MNDSQDRVEPNDFSLVLGGPLYQLFIRARIGTDTLGFLKRRILFITLFTWLPLLLLSLFPEGAADIKVPFIFDIEAHLRFLLALPLMLLAETVVHQRIRPLVLQFLGRGIIPAESLPQFESIIRKAFRLRNSVIMEVILIFLVFTGWHYIWSSQIVLEASTWISHPVQGEHQLTPAGIWYAFVSIPVFQFMLLRWYFRIFIWARFLWQISRLDLQLIPTHPDCAGGLGFLAGSVAAFMPLILAQGVLLTGLISNRIFFEGAKLLDFKLEIVAAVGLFLLLVLGPLCVFADVLSKTRRRGLLEYGALASQYVREFDQKWLRQPPPQGETLVGTGDIQSLNDLAGSFDVVRSMRLFPFGKDAVLQTIIIALVPVAPLGLTLISLEDLLQRLISILL